MPVFLENYSACQQYTDFENLINLYFSNNMGPDLTEFSRIDFSSISRTNSGEPLDVHFHIGYFRNHQYSSALIMPLTGLNAWFSNDVSNLSKSTLLKK